MITHPELVSRIANATELPRKAVEDVLYALAGEVSLAMACGETIVMPRIGSFQMPEGQRMPRFQPAKPLVKPRSITPSERR